MNFDRNEKLWIIFDENHDDVHNELPLNFSCIAVYFNSHSTWTLTYRFYKYKGKITYPLSPLSFCQMWPECWKTNTRSRPTIHLIWFPHEAFHITEITEQNSLQVWLFHTFQFHNHTNKKINWQQSRRNMHANSECFFCFPYVSKTHTHLSSQ